MELSISGQKLLALLLGARTLLGAPGIATRSKDATTLEAIAVRSKKSHIRETILSHGLRSRRSDENLRPGSDTNLSASSTSNRNFRKLLDFVSSGWRALEPI